MGGVLASRVVVATIQLMTMYLRGPNSQVARLALELSYFWRGYVIPYVSLDIPWCWAGYKRQLFKVNGQTFDYGC